MVSLDLSSLLGDPYRKKRIKVEWGEMQSVRSILILFCVGLFGYM